MTAFRADARAAASLAAALVLAAVLSAPALAQSSGPIRLAPLPDPVREDGRPPAGDAGLGQSRSPDGRGDVPVVDGDIVVRGLGAISREAVGLLGESGGGIGQVMWAGTDRARAIALVRALPARGESPAARDLARRALLTIAEPPAVASGGAPVEPDALLAARLDALVRMGSFADARNLAFAAASRDVPEALAASLVRLRFLEGDSEDACEAVHGHGGGYGSFFWQKALVVCQLVAGDPAQAGLGLDLLREQGQHDDRLFFALADAAVVDLPPDAERLAEPAPLDALDFVLLRRAAALHDDFALPAWVASDAPPAVLRATMESGELDPDRRLAAAHAALRAGSAMPADVARLYDFLEPTGDEVAAALLEPEGVSPDRRLAYLYLSARRQQSPVARSEALWEAWNAARETGSYDVVARMTAPLLDDIPATSDFGWISGHAARVLFAAGAEAKALSWYQLAERQGARDAAIGDEAVALWPLARIASVSDPMLVPLPADTAAATPASARVGDALPQLGLQTYPWRAVRMRRWIEWASGGPDAAARIGAMLAILGALDEPVDEAMWDHAAGAPGGAPDMPGIDVMAGLARAAEEGRRAEAALRAVAALGGGGPATAYPAVTVAAIRALRAVDLQADAAAIARDGALAQLR